jgi:hypothetical protein
MSPKNNKRAVSWLGWLVAGVLLIVSAGLFFERQLVIDTVQYYQYTPTDQIADITERLTLTDDAKFTFYASHPSLQGKETFNEYCERKEASSPIIGCYGSGLIYIYDVTDERLDGIEDVTAAHELLHAEFERLPYSEKQRLEPLLQAAYNELADEELTKRMEYYDRTQPGEKYNELHSIIPTEYATIGNELEEYYARYFKDRQIIVALHGKVDEQFSQLSEEADEKVAQIDSLAASINSATQKYNVGVATLNSEVSTFNARASQPGGFSSQAEFESERAALNQKRRELEDLRQQVKDDIETYEQLRSQLEAINAETASLNASIDSVLADEPEI